MEKVLTAGLTGFLVLFFGTALSFLSGFVLMIGMGAAHSVWDVVPTTSYWTSVALMAAWRVVWPFGWKTQETAKS